MWKGNQYGLQLLCNNTTDNTLKPIKMNLSRHNVDVSLQSHSNALFHCCVSEAEVDIQNLGNGDFSAVKIPFSHGCSVSD